MKTIYEMKCIKTEHTYEGETTVEYLTFEQFKNSFVDERWVGERRYNKQYSIFGYYHTKTIVTNPYNGEKSVRVFTFPKSQEQAIELDKEGK